MSERSYLGTAGRFGIALLLVILALVLMRYCLTAGLPLTAHAHGIHDDALFIRLAESIVSGEWLGEYDKLTLVKAPLYPLYIAANYLLGLQFKTMEHAIYIVACVIVYLALVKARVSPYLALVPFILLLFNPYHHGSVERGWFYAALVFLVIAGFYYMIAMRSVSGRIRSSHSFLLGLGLASLYLSREETIWLYPLLLVAFALLFYQPGRYGVLQSMSKVVPILLLGMAIPIAAVLSANYVKYGHFGIKDSAVKEFKTAFKLMKSVRTNEEKPFVDVTHQSLTQMFKVSPALAGFQHHLQGGLGKQWGGLMCKRHAEACNEIGGGYIFWALRDALAAEGYYQSPEKMKSVYGEISIELQQGCNSGQLDCSRIVWPLRYPVRIDRIDDYLAKLPDFVTYMVSGLHGRLPGYGSAHGPEERLEVFKKLSNTSIRPKAQQHHYSVSGWLISDSQEKYIAIVPKPFAAYSNRFSLQSSKDVQRHFIDNADSGLSRFKVEGPCTGGQCELLIMSGGEHTKLDQELIRAGADLKRGGLHLHIDSVKQVENKQQLFWVDQLKIDAFKEIGALYNHLLVYLSLFATLVFVVACFAFLFRNYRSLLLGGALIAVLGMAARLGVLALFDDFTQSPVVGQFRHFIPVMPLLLFYIGLNFLILFELPAALRKSTAAGVQTNPVDPGDGTFIRSQI
ncbi:MAG: hypothetical protein B6D72_17265 [gamma proteobacterium symbiont of Ctena orbiculata]|nr:hypothetical protein [Candidatus Thiodiazotropha taylori]PUB81353.1 MAG: hypothetical protein DBP00_19085 [gamma proteobacterium symbiont of Ctena orbiculata]PVV07991.1 MAG: hypothetical protein B6D72_17265 [gamma proteobacterium symbiont of Ctena orbiculata]PVV15417.1 MAG: hypothetical protein B6D82_03740 [gamma proteobacterium symbiont of Ctena orbiculata]